MVGADLRAARLEEPFPEVAAARRAAELGKVPLPAVPREVRGGFLGQRRPEVAAYHGYG